MLKFPDGTQVGINGLNEVFACLYAEGRQANQATAKEIINKLEEQKNFIPSSDRIRKEYAHALLREFARYVSERTTPRPKGGTRRMGVSY